METRFIMQDKQPAAWKAMYGLEIYLAGTEINKAHKELIKIRASQINGCAFCIDMHTKDAIKDGETTQHIFLLNAWKETDLFTAEEKAILAITEEITLIHNHGLSDATYNNAKQYFDETYIAQLIMAVVNHQCMEQDRHQHKNAGAAVINYTLPVQHRFNTHQRLTKFFVQWQ